MIMGLVASHKVWGEKIVNGLIDDGYRVIFLTTETQVTQKS